MRHRLCVSVCVDGLRGRGTRTWHVRVRDARTTRAGCHAEVEHQAGAGTARGSVMQGCVEVYGCVCVCYWATGTRHATCVNRRVCVLRVDGTW
eukprot:5942144-Prymnesium_polylepis.1